MDPSHYRESGLLTRAGFVHAFFTRRGGVSGGVFQSLNLSAEVGDEPAHVRENLRRVSSVLGVGPERVYVPRQVHGRAVLVLDGGPADDDVPTTPADALVSNAPGLACAVRTADCVPILLADPSTGRVAAIHAGWRGVVQNVVGASAELMISLGSRPEALLAAIGPHISASAFEVGEEVAQLLTSSGAGECFIERSPGNKAHVDLAGIVSEQLIRAGLAPTAVERVEGCTYRDQLAFFSYRRDGKTSGRSLSAIVSRGRPSAPAPGKRPTSEQPLPTGDRRLP
jgi:YfiH family protein